MTFLTLLNFGLALALGLTYDRVRDLNGRIVDLEQQIIVLKSASSVDAVVSDSGSPEPITTTSQPTAVIVRSDPTPSSSEPLANQEAENAAKWRASYYLSEVEKLVALSATQRAELSARYAEEFAKPDSKPAKSYRELLRSSLGDEIAARFEIAQKEERARREQERLAGELFQFSRKLSLTNEQEATVGEVLKVIGEELRPVTQQLETAMQSAMGNHSAADSNKDELRASYDQIKELNLALQEAKNAALSQRLKTVLSETQYNALLEILATERAGF
jgi:hypothetical protein